VAEKGTYEIRVGTSSTNIRLTKPVQLEQSFTWKGLDEPTPFELY
jgi:beta-glucosidase